MQHKSKHFVVKIAKFSTGGGRSSAVDVDWSMSLASRVLKMLLLIRAGNYSGRMFYILPYHQILSSHDNCVD